VQADAGSDGRGSGGASPRRLAACPLSPTKVSHSISSGKRSIRAWGVVMLVLSLGACAAHTWAPGPGMSAADFEPAKARCSLLARHSGSDFAAFGSESYVAGAAVGHVIGESVRTQQDFNDCMLAGGWRIADQPATAAPAAQPYKRTSDAPAVAASPPVAPSATAPATPATPPAAFAPAVPSAAGALRTTLRTVASGERQKIGFYYHLNPDCTSSGNMTVRIITPPAHGEVTTDRGLDYTNFPKENQRYQCNLNQSPGSNVYYKSKSGIPWYRLHDY
jgi:hypothetical protein